MKELDRITTVTRLLVKAEGQVDTARVNRDLLILKASQAGATQVEIATAAGMSQPAVQQILQKVRVSQL